MLWTTGREIGYIDALQQHTEAVYELLNVQFELVNESLVVLRELAKIWYKHFHELNKFLPDKTHIALEPQDEWLNENRIGKDGNTLFSLVFRHLLVSVIVLEVAVIQDKVEEVDDVDLHGVVLFLCDLVECLDQWLDYNVSNSVRNLTILFNLLQNKLHELAGGSINGKRFSKLILFLALIRHIDFFFGVFGPDEEECDLYQDIHVLHILKTLHLLLHPMSRTLWNLPNLILWRVLLGSKLLVEEVHDVFLDIFEDHVFDYIILRIQNDVSQLSKVFNHILGFKIALDNDGVMDFKVWVFEEFFN